MGLERFSHDEQASESSSSKEMAPSPVQPPLPHAEHGPVIDHKISQDNVVQASPELAWSRIRHQLREPLSEFFVS
jgi:aquaglyceroporin related protein, other eukaryote